MKNKAEASLTREIRRLWKPRRKDAHKGDFGRVFILAGSEGMAGAAALAAAGALYSGAGLVTLGVPSRIYTIAASFRPEVMVKPFASTSEGSLALSARKDILDFCASQDVLALGPGLSRHPGTQKLVRALIQEVKLPMVVDADGLNALEGHTENLLAAGKRAVITPHPGEFKRLFGEVPAEDADRIRKASMAVRRYGVTVVLKGHRTVIASPGEKPVVNRTGNPGMAAGGTGDVLTGIIAALLGQGFDSFDAARFGVFFHGLAGDMAVKETGETGLTATGLVRYLPRAYLKVLGR